MLDWVLIVVFAANVCSVEAPPKCETHIEVIVEKDLTFAGCQRRKLLYPKTEELQSITCSNVGDIAGVEGDHLIEREKQAKILKKEI